MEGLAACSSAGVHFVHLLPAAAASGRKQRSRCLRVRRSSPFPPYVACRGGGGQPELDQWDLMGLKFGRLLGEDPKLTMAKVMARKANPDVSYLDVEKSFRKKKGGVDYGEDLGNDSVGEDLEVGGKPLRSLARLQAPRRPENAADGSKLNLVRPAMDKEMKAASAVEKPVPASPTQRRRPAERVVAEDAAPNVALRRPNLVHEEDLGMENLSKLRIKPNLVLKMRKGPVES